MKTNSSLGIRNGLAILGLALLIPAAQADRVMDTGQRALKTLIESRSNRGVRPFFQTTERQSSGNDILLTGRGYTTRGTGRGNGGSGRGNAPRNFTYSVRVERGGQRARDLMVRFANGDTLRDAGTYDRNGRPGNGNGDWNDGSNYDRPTITKPEANFTDRDGDVTFEGRSEANNITLFVTDLNDRNRQVTTRRVSVRNGRWSTNLRLNSGRYRARITNDGRAEFDRSDTVDFRVDGNGNGNDNRATFDRPENNFRDTDGEIRFSGDSEGREVELKIYRGNREVSSRRISVRDDRWDVTIRLDDGDYRATIRTTDGRGTDAVRFSVRRK